MNILAIAIPIGLAFFITFVMAGLLLKFALVMAAFGFLGTLIFARLLRPKPLQDLDR